MTNIKADREEYDRLRGLGCTAAHAFKAARWHAEYHANRRPMAFRWVGADNGDE